MTLRENIEQFKALLPWKTLPQLFRDVVILAQKLNVRYIWIDSLCIIQDDQNDKAKEIPRMGDIFQGAFVVIIAANSSSPRASILNHHKIIRSPSLWQDLTSLRHGSLDLSGVKFRSPPHIYPGDACMMDRITKRAWTYQERLLARRCLVFRPSDVVWECKKDCRCECSGEQSLNLPKRRLASQLLSPLRGSSQHQPESQFFADASSAYSFWKTAVQTYSSRRMSHATDRLPAISALARVVSTATGDEYLAGLWRNDLIAQLVWEITPSYGDNKPFLEYVGPSWSWVSSSETARFPDPGAPSCATVVRTWCQLANADPFGPVDDGALILCGQYCTAEVFISIRPHPDSPQADIPYMDITLENGVLHSADSRHHEYSFLDGFRVQEEEMRDEAGHAVTSIQRTLHIEDEQRDCSGTICVLWLTGEASLLLTRSRSKPGAFERLGMLRGEACPPIPNVQMRSIELR